MHYLLCYDICCIYFEKRNFNKLLSAAIYFNNYKYLLEIVIFLNYILVCIIKMCYK